MSAKIRHASIIAAWGLAVNIGSKIATFQFVAIRIILPTVMSIQGLSHLTFIVRDLERSARLLCVGLGAQEVYDSAAHNFSLSREKFFTLGGMWIALMEGDATTGRSYRHVAFQVDERDIEDYEQRLRALGVEIAPARSRVAGEGASLYFHDYDNNLFELHSGTLEKRLARYAQHRLEPVT